MAANIKDAKANGGKLSLVGMLPWIAGLLGLISLLAGLILGTVFTVVIVAVVVASLVLGVGFFTELVGACQDSPEGTIWGIPYTCN